MNRRILLIDHDPKFRDTLARELGRYRIDIEVAADGEKAIASAASDPPALIVIGVEEPDKAGFKTFQKCRKAIAKVPIAMVTSSVAAASFKRHAEGKVHAELYLDKRGMGEDELVGKLDNVIGLGDAGGRHVDPARGRRHPDGGRRERRGRRRGHQRQITGSTSTRRRRSGRWKASCGSTRWWMPRLDATFAALLGDDSTAAPIVTESMPEPEPAHVEEAAPAEIIHDSGHHTPPPEELAIDAAAPQHEHEHEHEVAAAPPEPEPEPAPRRYESSPAIALDVGDIESLDDDAIEEVEEVPVTKQPKFVDAATVAMTQPPSPSQSQPIPRMVERSGSGGSRSAAVETKPATGLDLGLDVVAEEADREQSGVHDRRSLRKIGELERQVAQLKGELERARGDAQAAASAGSREREFLGLREQLANKDKDVREAREALAARERVLVDVRDELRQARVAHQTAQQHADELTGRVDRLATLDAAHRAATSELAVARQELDARTAAHGAAEAARQQAERDLATERAARAANASEAERILRAERDQLVARHDGELAAARERADGEREAALAALRAELEIAHVAAAHAAADGARAAADAEHARARDAADAAHARTRAEAEAAHAEALSRARADAEAAAAHAASQLDAVRADHATALAAATAGATAAATDQHERDLAGERERHAAEIAEITERAQAAAAAAAQAARAELVSATEKHRKALEQAQAEAIDASTTAAAEHADAIEALEQKHAAEAGQLAADRDAARGEHQAAAAAHQAALADHRAALSAHAEALAARDREHQATLDAHADELAARDRDREAALDELAGARGRDAQAHQEQVIELRAEIDRRGNQVEALRGELAKQAEDHEAARAELASAHQGALDGATAAHEAAVSRAKSQHDKELAAARSEHERAAAVAKSEHERAVAVMQSDHARALADAKTAHDRQLAALEESSTKTAGELTSERDELKRGLSGARDAHKRVEGELAAAVQTIADRNAELRTHAAGIAERDQRIAELRRELEALEQENAQYQEQVLRAYQKIKADEAMVARAKKAMAIALTVLDQPQPSVPNGPTHEGSKPAK